MFNEGGLKFVSRLMNTIHPHTRAPAVPGVFGERAIDLQTEGTRVPERAGDEAQAAGWSPLQTAPLCAAPGCPQYLKTESEQRGDAKTIAHRGRKGRGDEEGRMEEEKGTRKGERNGERRGENQGLGSKNVALRNFRVTADVCCNDLYLK